MCATGAFGGGRLVRNSQENHAHSRGRSCPEAHVGPPGCPAWTVVRNADSECFNSSVAILKSWKEARQAKSSLTTLRIIQPPITFQPFNLELFPTALSPPHPGSLHTDNCSFCWEQNGDYLVGNEALTSPSALHFAEGVDDSLLRLQMSTL